MPFIGDVLIDIIEREDLNESTDTTDHALEDGEQITDHAYNKPIILNISGVVIDPSDEKLLKIRKYREGKEVISYSYRSRLETVLITAFNSKRDARHADGYTFNMTLKQIRIVKAADVVRVSVPVNKQLKAVTSVGKKKVKKTSSKTSKKKTTTKSKPKITKENSKTWDKFKSEWDARSNK